MPTTYLFLLILCACIAASFPWSKDSHVDGVVRGRSSSASSSNKTPFLRRRPLNSQLLVRDETHVDLEGLAASSIPAKINVTDRLPRLPFVFPVIGTENIEISIYATKEETLIPQSAIKFIFDEFQKFLTTRQFHEQIRSPLFLQIPQARGVLTPESPQFIVRDALFGVLALDHIVNKFAISYGIRYTVQAASERGIQILASGTIQLPDRSDDANLAMFTLPSQESGQVRVNKRTGSSDPKNKLSMNFYIPETNLEGRTKFDMTDHKLSRISMDSCRQKIKTQLSLNKEWLLLDHLEASVGDVTLILEPILTHTALIGVNHQDAERGLKALFGLIYAMHFYFPMEYYFSRHGQEVARGYILWKIGAPMPAVPTAAVS